MRLLSWWPQCCLQKDRDGNLWICADASWLLSCGLSSSSSIFFLLPSHHPFNLTHTETLTLSASIILTESHIRIWMHLSMASLYPPEKAVFHRESTSQNHTMQLLCRKGLKKLLHIFLIIIFFYSKTFEYVLYLKHHKVSLFRSQGEHPIHLSTTFLFYAQ